MNARQHTITLCGAAQDVKIATILLHYLRVERQAELSVGIGIFKLATT